MGYDEVEELALKVLDKHNDIQLAISITECILHKQSSVFISLDKDYPGVKEALECAL